MQLTGSTIIRLPRDRVADALYDPAILRLMIPACREIERLNETDFKLGLVHETGPIKLRLAGKLVVTPVTDLEHYRFAAEVKNLIAGSARITLDLHLGRVQGGTQMDHAGEIAATGLAGRLLSGKEQALVKRTDAMFARLKGRLEAREQGGKARQAP